MGEAVGVVLAAGLGTRVGADGNKAYLPLAGRSMLAWSLDTLTRLPEVARTILVFRRGEYELARDTVHRELPDAQVELVEGGDTRHASESNVLSHLAADIDSETVDVVAIPCTCIGTTTTPNASSQPGKPCKSRTTRRSI